MLRLGRGMQGMMRAEWWDAIKADIKAKICRIDLPSCCH